MDIGKLSYWCRRIHRISLWFVTVSGLLQALTGLAQEFPAFQFTDMGTIVQIHTLNSVFFVVFLLVSIITGLIMYFSPWLIKHLQKH
jgi:hypothetical protein